MRRTNTANLVKHSLGVIVFENNSSYSCEHVIYIIYYFTTQITILYNTYRIPLCSQLKQLVNRFIKLGHFMNYIIESFCCFIEAHFLLKVFIFVIFFFLIT